MSRLRVGCVLAKADLAEDCYLVRWFPNVDAWVVAALSDTALIVSGAGRRWVVLIEQVRAHCGGAT